VKVKNVSDEQFRVFPEIGMYFNFPHSLGQDICITKFIFFFKAFLTHSRDGFEY